MPAAYSRLRFLLEERGLTRAELRRRMAASRPALNGAALSRLLNPDRLLAPEDIEVAGFICHALGVELDDLVVFVEPSPALLQTLPKRQQQRLNELMDRHNEGQLNDEELDALRTLVAEADAIARGNAERLVQHRRRLKQREPIHLPSAPR